MSNYLTYCCTMCNYLLSSKKGSTMKDVKDIRLDNFFILIKEESNPTLTDIAKRMGGTGKSTICQLKNGTRPITANMARRIEEAYKKPFGWMDKPLISEVIPYEHDIVFKVLSCIYNVDKINDLYEPASVNGKAAIFDDLYLIISTKDGLSNLPIETLHTIFGVELDNKNKTRSEHNKPSSAGITKAQT